MASKSLRAHVVGESPRFLVTYISRDTGELGSAQFAELAPAQHFCSTLATMPNVRSAFLSQILFALEG